jgi:MFS family permease
MSLSPSAARIVASLGVAYIASQFFRSCMAAVAPEMMRELALGPEAMGALTGAFFAAFALAQMPAGMLLDRFGARIVVFGTLMVAVLGAVIFGLGEGVLVLGLGRVLQGIGCAAVLLGALVVGARWVPLDRFAQVSGTTVAIGMIGTIGATLPLAAAAEAFGWRACFLAAGLGTFVLSLSVLVVVRDAPPGHAYHARTPERARDVVLGFRAVFANPKLRYLFVMQFVAYAALVTVAGLWGGPFLADRFGMDPVARGHVLLGMSVAMLCGNLFYGRIDRVFDSRKRVALGAAWASALWLALLGLAGEVWQAALLMALLGFSASYMSILHAHGRAIFPPHLTGRGLSVLNMSVMLGSAAMQAACGWVIGLYVDGVGPAPGEAYRAGFGFVALVLVAASLYYARIPDSRPSEDVAAADSAP